MRVFFSPLLFQNSVQKFYEGVCAFVKAVAAYNSILHYHATSTPEPLLVVLLDTSNNVHKLSEAPLPLEGKVSAGNCGRLRARTHKCCWRSTSSGVHHLRCVCDFAEMCRCAERLLLRF